MGNIKESWGKRNSSFTVRNVHHKTKLHKYIGVQFRFLTFELLIILCHFLIVEMFKLRKIHKILL